MTESEVFTIPNNLAGWNIAVIDKLIELQFPESDTLDFKEDVSELEKDICGFANSYGGFIVLGISGKDKAEQKNPLANSREHDIIQQITGRSALVDPNTTITMQKVPEGSSFYMILKIENCPHSKPFNLKSTGGFYVRINGATYPASRSIILNLFTDNIGKHQRLTVLKNTVEILITELNLRKNQGSLQIHPTHQGSISEIDLSYIKSSIINTGDLIFGLDETGRVDGNSTYYGLLTATLPKLEELNVNLRAFNNSEINSEGRKLLSYQISEFGRGISGTITELNRFKVAIERLLEQ